MMKKIFVMTAIVLSSFVSAVCAEVIPPSQSDAKSEWFSSKDASNEFNSAMEITPGEQEFMSYAPDNEDDVYVMKLKAGKEAMIVLTPGQAQGYFRITTYDDKLNRMDSITNKQPGAAISLTAVNNGPDMRIYIKVDRDGKGDPAGEYTIKVAVK
jgi:hypothetical protein